MLSQLSPIMQQLAGVDLQRLLQDLARLPGAAADAVASPARPVKGKVFETE